MEKALLKPREIAHALRVAVTTIARWRQRGIIPCIRVNATTFRYELSAVVNALRARSVAQASAPDLHPPPDIDPDSSHGPPPSGTATGGVR